MPAYLRSDLDVIHTETDRCRKIVRNLLAFARPTPAEKQVLSINALVENTLALKSYQLGVRDITVRQDLSHDLPAVLGDPQCLQQVFLNILNNAHDAITEGGRPGSVTVTTTHTNGTVQVAFADTGIGMPADVLPCILEPFFTTKPPGKGTGLGLSLTHEIIRDHHGTLDIASVPGRGTTFTVSLPVARKWQAPAPGRAVVEGARSRVSGLRVLFVDDEPTLLELVTGLLTMDGHEVTTAATARDALALVENQPEDFHLIITDVRMPGLSGEDLHERLSRLTPPFAGNIIFTTGDTGTAETVQRLTQTGKTVLVKPFHIDDLRRAIETAAACT